MKKILSGSILFVFGSVFGLTLSGVWAADESPRPAFEEFTSMEALREFWFSNDYQAAKKLREGLSTINFIVAVEGN